MPRAERLFFPGGSTPNMGRLAQVLHLGARRAGSLRSPVPRGDDYHDVFCRLFSPIGPARALLRGGLMLQTEELMLTDGTHVTLRPIRPDDKEELARAFSRLSSAS